MVAGEDAPSFTPGAAVGAVVTDSPPFTPMTAARILIVEPQRLLAQVLEEQLRGFGHEVVGLAASGDEALQLAVSSRPALALVDIDLCQSPQGLSAAVQLRRLYRIPIVMLGQAGDPALVARTAAVLPCAYLSKPCRQEELRAALTVALHTGAREARLQEAEHWFTAAFENLGDGVVLCEPDGSVRQMNQRAEAMIGCSRIDARHVPLDSLLRLTDMHRQAHYPFEVLTTHDEPGYAEPGQETETLGLTLHRPDGATSTVDLRSSLLFHPDGPLLGGILTLRDAQPRLDHEATVLASENRLRKLFEVSPSGMALLDDRGRLKLANPALGALLGCDADALLGEAHAELGLPEDRDFELEQLQRLMRRKADSVRFEKHYRRADGSHAFLGLVSATLLAEDDGTDAVLLQITDLTDSRQAEAQRLRQTFFDPLTGLGNRARLHEQLEMALTYARREKFEVTVLHVDLDGFKWVYDRFGHRVADECMRKIARRLQRSVRESDCVGRMSADDFALVLPKAGASSSIARLMEKVRRSISTPMLFEGTEIRITASIGAAVFPHDGGDTAALLRAADAASAAAKQEGGDQFAFFHLDMGRRVEQRMAVEMRLRQAISRDELFLEFQPICDFAGGAIEGFEALVRWQRDDEVVPPAAFVPFAEESGLIVPIGAWVLREACRQATAWPESISVSVNCSAVQFRDRGFFDTVRQALADTGLRPQRLRLELTESMMLHGDETRAERLAQLREIGVTLSVDDYGTGYSSLAYLKHFAPKTLKIDKVFVDDITTDISSQAIVTATIAMAHKLGMRVVAEGVETQAQYEQLQGCGCDFVQGFLTGRPGSAAAALAAIAQSGAAPARPDLVEHDLPAATHAPAYAPFDAEDAAPASPKPLDAFAPTEQVEGLPTLPNDVASELDAASSAVKPTLADILFRQKRQPSALEA